MNGNKTLVRKRDGMEVLFNPEKINVSVSKALLESARIKGTNLSLEDMEMAAQISMAVQAKVMGRESVSIDMIQDLVIAELEDRDSEVAKLYQEYRMQRDTGRDRESKETKYALKVLKGGDDSNQNGNVDGSSFGGKMGAILDNIMKKLALNYFMSKKSADNHIRNRIYSHDLSHYAAGDPNCLNIPTDYVSKHGMEVKQADIREPQSVATWCQLLAVQCQVQSLSQFGGVGFTHLDHSAVPYIRKSFRKKCFIAWLYLHPEKFKGIDILKMYSTNHQEEISKGVYIVKSDLDVWLDKNKEEFYEEMKLKEEDFVFGNREKIGEIIYNQAMLETLKEIKQAVEGLFHNLNSLQSRSGNQLPFTSINYGTCTLEEGRAFTRAILTCSIEGIGKNHRTSIFPCQIFQYMRGVNSRPEEPNWDLYQLALRSLVQRDYPNFVNVNWSGRAGFDPKKPSTYAATMGERNSAHVKSFEPRPRVLPSVA